LFTVQLGSNYGIDISVFNNGDRHLQIWICATGTGCTTFDDLGRLPVSSSAYAQTLHLPAELEDSSTGYLLEVTNNGSNGIIGVSTASSGATAGVSGQSSSTAGRGVAGIALATSGATIGVAGQSNSTGGTGVLGVAGATTGTIDAPPAFAAKRLRPGRHPRDRGAVCSNRPGRFRRL
jgi:hypothetical protein